jgi:tight adherence protein B
VNLAAALTSGLCIFAATLFALAPTRRRWVRGRLAPHAPSGRERGDLRETFAALVDATDARLGTTRAWRALDLLREGAGIARGTAELVYGALAVSLALVVLLLAFGGAEVMLFLAPPGVAAAGLLALRAKARRRRDAFDEQLPQILDSLAASLKVGHSLTQSLQAMTADALEPAASEFGRVLAETRLGRPLEVALDDLSQRLRSDEFEFVLMSITVQRQVGGSLAALLETVAETVRHRQQFARRIRALTSMGRLSARVLVGLPFVAAALLTAVNPGYMSPLVDTQTGQTLILASLGMIGAGSLMLRRIVSGGMSR